MKPLIEHLEDIKDPRKVSMCHHNITEIIVIAILAVICKAETWTDIEMYGKAKKEWLRKFLILENGIPSHDTFNRVFSMLDPNELTKSFMNWVESISIKMKRDVIAIDGKSTKGSKRKSIDNSMLHVVSAWSRGNQLVLGQKKVADKSNEITAIPEILDMLDIEDSIITIDAIGTQIEIAKKIKEKKADYVLALKGNQKNLHEDVKFYFQEEVMVKSKKELKDNGIYLKNVEKDHGRIEKREYYMINDVKWLEQKENWQGLSSIGMVVNTIERSDEKQKVGIRYYIMSGINDVKEFEKAVRGHWHIENKLHWCLDVVLREDSNRTTKDHAPENLAILRKMVLNIFKLDKKTKGSMRGKRFKASIDCEYLEFVLKQII